MSNTSPSFHMCFVTGAQAVALSMGSVPTNTAGWMCPWRGIAKCQKSAVMTYNHFCSYWPGSPLSITHHKFQEGLGSCYGSSCILTYLLCILTPPGPIPSPHPAPLPPPNSICLFKVSETAVDSSLVFLCAQKETCRNNKIFTKSYSRRH